LLLAAAATGVIGQAFDGQTRAGLAVFAAMLASFAGAIAGYESLMGFGELERLYASALRSLKLAEVDWDELAAEPETPEQVEKVESIFHT
jgi:hypothetical protein